MGVSKKLRNKRKKNLIAVLFGTAILTSMLAVMKISGFLIPEKETVKLSMQEELRSEYQSSSIDNAETEPEPEDVGEYSVRPNEETTNFTVNSTPLKNLSTTSQVASGETFGVALKEDGTVWTWGNNTYGQLGNGKIENVSTEEPNRVLAVNGNADEDTLQYLENIKQISVGRYNGSALTQDGKVVTWGLGTSGQLGNNTAVNSGVPVYVQKQVTMTDDEGNETQGYEDLSDIVQISQGSNHVLALASDGTVWSWGLNNYGQLGINVGNTTSSNANYKRIYAVKVQKQVSQTITNEDGTESTTTHLEDLDNIKQISGGTDFSVALTNDGTVFAWGLGTSGQIGNNGAVTVYIPAQVKINANDYLTDVEKIDAGGLQTIALKTDGTVWAWGINRYGNLGINASSTTTSNANYKRIYAVQVLKAAGTPLTDVKDISSIYETSFALTEDGEVYGWGLNTSGQIGDYTVTNRAIATLVKESAVSYVNGIKSLGDGQHTNTNLMIDEEGIIHGTGVSSSHQLMSNRNAGTFFAVKLNERYLQIENNQEYIEVGQTKNLTVSYNKGFNLKGQITVGNLQYRSSNEDIATVDNTGKLTAKSRGQVTIIAEDTTDGYTAEAIINVVSKGTVALPQVVSGTTFTAYLKEDGTVWTSGASGSGELGNGSNISINTPVQVKINTNEYLTDIRKIAVGEQHALALRKDGTVWSWGINTSGRLGVGSTTISRYAVQVHNTAGDGYLEDIVDIDAGVDNSSALTRNGEVYAWGDNATYQSLGINSSTASFTRPVLVHGITNAIQVQSGQNNIIALKGDGTVWGAGQNNVGQLADSTTTSPRAEMIPFINTTKDGLLTGIVRIASGNHHTVALKEDKTALTWGYNRSYQQGTNTTANQLSPIDIKLNNTDVIENIYDIATGPEASYVKTGNGNVYVVGINGAGQLSVGDAATPKKVFMQAVNENKEPLTDIATINKSNGTSFGFAFEDGTVGITGLGTSGQHGNLTWANSNQITKIDNASLVAGDLYEIKVNESKNITLGVTQGFNLNIDNKTEISLGTLTYESLDEEIATVSQDGTITGIKAGTTGIVITDETNGLETTAQVVVGERELSDIYKIVAGDSHTVLLKNDGTVWSWGDNTYGQLGNGTIGGKEVETAEQVLGVNGEGYLTDVIDISAGTYFTVALKKNGQVVAWGVNTYGQIGAPNDVAENPVYVKDYNGNILSGVIEISASRDHAVALKADGTVWTWGRNDYYQLGNNTNVNSSYAVQVLANANGEYLTDVKQVSCGGAFVVALKNDGTVWSWGLNSNSQTGNLGTASPQKFPVQAKEYTSKAVVTGVKKISTGHHYVLALKEDGTVWSWGLNDYGQLGIGVSSTSSSNGNYRRIGAVQVKLDSTNMLEDIVDVSTILRTSYALTSDGTLYSWGRNEEYQLGNNTTSANSNYPTKVVRRYGAALENKIVKLMGESPNAYTGYAIREDGSIIGFGRVKNGQILDGGLYTTRNYAEDVLSSYLEITERNSYIKLGETKKLNVRTVENVNVFGIAPEYGNLTWKSTNEDVAVVDQNGNITTKNLGSTTIIVTEDLHGYTALATIYVTANKENVITSPMIVQGTSFTGILKADGTVWTTGLNASGQLGDGTKDYRAELKQVQIDENTYLTNVLRISAGASHMLAVTNSGEVYAWGLGTSGQLGNGGTTNSSYAQKVLDETGEGYLSNIIDVTAGANHSLALDKDGKVYAWGKGGNYQLGNHATANKTLPIKMPDEYNIVKISAGTEYTVLLRGDGVALATGLNTNGWLATGNTTTANTPLEMGNATDKVIYDEITDIATGGTHTILLKEDGKAYAVGLGTSGQLAQNGTGNLNIPAPVKILKDETGADGETVQTPVELENIVQISAGNTTTFVVTKDGKAYATGLNTSGQLGLGDRTSPVTTFKEVLDETGENTLQNVAFIAKGPSNTINSGYILKDGTVWVSGIGVSGQLGNEEYLDYNNVVKMGVDKLKAKEDNIRMQRGNTHQIDISLGLGFNAYNNTSELNNSNIKYESANSSVASVSSTGLITATGVGTTKIKVTDTVNNLIEYVNVEVLQVYNGVKPQMLSGSTQTVALKGDGTIWIMGSFSDFPSGDGTSAGKTIKQPVQLVSPTGEGYVTNGAQIAPGVNHFIALLQDGTVIGWGNNDTGECGNNKTGNVPIPEYVVDANGEKIKDIIRIASGGDNTLALTKDGEVYAWGENDYGQLGNGTSASGAYSKVAVKVKDSTGKGVLTDIKDVYMTYLCCYALTSDGELWAWGKNTDGEMGIGNTSNSSLPKKVPIDNIATIRPNTWGAVALKENGELWGWGWNKYYQVSGETTATRTTPVQLKYDADTPITDAKMIGTSAFSTYFQNKAGKIYGIGINNQGQLANGTTTTSQYPTELLTLYGEEITDEIVDISHAKTRTSSDEKNTGSSVVYLTKADGTVMGAGYNGTSQLTGSVTGLKYLVDLNSSFMEIEGRNITINKNSTKQLKVNMVENFNLFGKTPEIGNLTWESSNPDVVSVDTNGLITAKTVGEATIIVKEDKYGYTAQAIINVTEEDKNFIAKPMISQGLSFTAVLKADGTVMTTGLNTNGKLGDGTTDLRADFEKVKINSNTYLDNIVKIATGENFMLALSKDGEVYAWGLNSSGQLGQGNTRASSYAIKVLNTDGTDTLKNIVDISAGQAYSMAVNKDGFVYAWGANGNSQCGLNGNTTNQTLPVQMEEVYNAISVSAGLTYNSILLGTGEVKSVGLGTSGQLGNNSSSTQSVARYVINETQEGMLRDVVQITTSANTTVALKKDGSIVGWGLNTSGQLAQNQVATNTNYPLPLTELDADGETLKPIKNIKELGARNGGIYAVTKTGQSYVSGINTAGQLGINSVASPVTTMEKVLDIEGENYLNNVIGVSRGSSNTLNGGFILKNGTVLTVGTGDNGQLGNGEFVSSYLPIIAGNYDLKAKERTVKITVNGTNQIELSMEQGINVWNIENEVGSNVKYESLNDKIATVNNTGLITGKRTGTTKIKITDLSNNLVEYVEVNVVASCGYTEAKVEAGLTFTVALKEDGTVWAWGNGADGKLGTGNTTNQSEAVQVLSPEGNKKLTKVKDIAVGYDSATALLENGTLVSWGNNGSYNLGDGTNTNRSTPVYVVDSNGDKLQNIIKIARGNDFILALTKDGEIYSWGYNNYGQLGNSNTTTTATPAKVKDSSGKGTLKNIIDIACGMRTSYALTEDGELWVWGYNGDGEFANGATSTSAFSLPRKVTTIDNIAKIKASSYSVIALKEDGSLWSWGWGTYGQIGNGGTANATTPVQPLFDADTIVSDKVEIIDIGTTGVTHYILTSDNKVYATGQNKQGQVGDNTAVNKSYFVEVKAKYGGELTDKIVKLNRGIARPDSSEDTGTAYLIREDGSILGLGKNSSYQLFGTMTAQLNSAKEMEVSYMEITDRISRIKVGGTKKLSTNIVENFNIYAKTPVNGNLTWSSSNTQIATVDENGNVTALKEGRTTITAVDSKYGYTASAVIYVIRNTENTITEPQVEQGLNFTAVLKADGTVWATGANNVGQCGQGTTIANISEPTQVKINNLTPLTNVVKISCGESHVLALTSDGKVYAWGLNTSGQLGINTKVNSLYAVQMLDEYGVEPVKNIVDISAGKLFSTVLTKNGDVYATGINEYGQLGDGTNTTRQILVKVKEVENIVQISAGQRYIAMLKGDSTVWVVGQNYYGQTGANFTTRGDKVETQGVNLARQTMNETKDGVLKDVTEISAGGWHITALNKDKEVFTWGYGKDGQIGNNAVNEINQTPQKLLDPTELATTGDNSEDGDGVGAHSVRPEVIGKVMRIGSSERVTFVITDEGKVYGTGENSNYQLSQNNNTDLLTLNQLYSQDGENYIDDILNTTRSSTNTNNTALIKKDGTVWVSGLCANGQIGNGEFETATVYTRMGASSISNDDKIVTIAEGETYQLNIQVANGFNVYADEKDSVGNLTYTVLNTEVATVSNTGLITAKKQGQVRVKIFDNDSMVTTSVLVEVTRDANDKVQAEVEAGVGSVLLKTDGTVWTFGDNTYGQRGIGDTSSHTEEVQVLDPNGKDKLTNVINVSAGSYFMVAVKEDGRVVTWGRNIYGQLGNNLTANSSIPVYVVDANGIPLTDVIKVSCGNEFAVALKKDGTVWAWGKNDRGELGQGNTTNSKFAVQVKDRTGKGYLVNIADISAQGHSVASLTETGNVYCWGYNYDGQCGNGVAWKAGAATLPVQTKITDVVQIASGLYHTLAVKSDGTLWSWGINRYGELGYGSSSTTGGNANYFKSTPVQIKIDASTYLENVVDIGTTYETSFAKTKEGTVYGWGYNSNGQLGVNNKTNYNLAQILKTMYGSDFTEAVAKLPRSSSRNVSYMIKEDGTVLGWGHSGTYKTFLTERTTDLTTVTELRPDFMEIERATYLKQSETGKLTAKVAERLNAFAEHIKPETLTWSSSDERIATVSNDGTVTAVGLGEAVITVKDLKNGYQAQGIIYVIQNEEKAVAKPDISYGQDFLAVLKADGTVWTTGLNTSGQLGDGTTTNRTTLVQVKTSSREYLTDIVKISAGTDHVVALSKTGEVYTWGLNDVGQLGNGTTTKNPYAIKVSDSTGLGKLNKVIDVSAGHKFSIVLLENGDVYGFGRNAYGELGTLNNANKLLPTKMDGIANAVKVQANSSGSSIQIGDGTVWTTGYNYYGTLGQNGTNTGSTAASQGRSATNPVINATRNGVLKNVVKMVTGLHQTIVLTEDHKVFVWGYNNVGQLGTGNTTNFAYPVSMKVQETGEELTDKVIDIGASGYRTLVKTEDDEGIEHVLITGYNNNGQLGNNTTVNSTSLIPVMDENNLEEKEGLDILQDDSRATDNTGYIDYDGKVWTVGLNNYGQIGDDTLYQRKNIVQIGEISLRPDELTFTMHIGDTKEIKTYIEDSFNVYIKTIQAGNLKYETLDKQIAEVDEKGIVTAKQTGSTLIRITDTSRDIQTAVYVKVIKNQEDLKYEPMVVGGSNHSVALKGDGSVWAWGYNKYGQLGNNTTVTTEIPTQVLGKDGNGYLENIQMIASGTNHTLALKDDGTVWAWGYNNYGQLGDNTQITRYTPIQVMSEDGTEYLKDIIYISAGTNYSMAVNKFGEVYAWGQNNYGQLGDGSKVARYTPVKVKANLTGIIQVACGETHTVALKSDGTVYTWGRNNYGQLSDNTNTDRTIPVKALESSDTYIKNAIGISATANSTNILNSDGEVLAVGLGTSGQLGDNTNVTKKLPVKAVDRSGTGELTGIATIKSGRNTTYALTKNGNVYAWGLGTSGQLGNNTAVNSLRPVLISNSTGDGNLENILYIGAGANHGFAVENNGYVISWGLNDQKQIGDSTLATSILPIYIGSKETADTDNITLYIGNTQKITVTAQSFNLFKAEEDLVRDVSFESLNPNVASVDENGVITGNAMGVTKILAKDVLSGKVAIVNVTVLKEGYMSTPKVASGLNHTVALKADGTVWTWGYNAYGQLGNGTTTSVYVPTKINIDNVIDVGAGEYFSVALKKDGTVWAWGNNDQGQLGQGNTTKYLEPVQVKGVNGNGYLSNVTKIAACRNRWLALLGTTEVVGCGNNTGGALGDNTLTNRTTPVYMVNYNGVGNVTGVKDIAAGYCVSGIAKEDGSVWTTGHNCNGDGGIGNTSTYSRIKQVKDSSGKGVLNNIIQLSFGNWYSMALDSNGNVWSWGDGSNGQLGLNSTADKSLPQKVLGVGGTGYLEDIINICAGYYSSYAVDRMGNVYSWGYNNNGQLGLNNTTTMRVPRQVLNDKGDGNLDNVMLVSEGGYHATFVKYDGTVWTVGYNKNGELGNDTNINSKLVGCISNPKLEVDEKLITLKTGETKKIKVTASAGFNLLTNEIEAGNCTYESLDTDIATVRVGNASNTGDVGASIARPQENIAEITGVNPGTTYIRITNASLGLTTTVKIVVPVRDGSTYAKIEGGVNHYVALKADGTVWTWGLNTSGQLGLGNTINKSEPTYTNQSGVIDIAAGAYFTAILKADGTVWVSGQNNYGQLGQNTTTTSNAFIQVKSETGVGYLTDVIGVTANNYYMAALKKDGTVYTWGYNKYGQLGDNSTSDKKLPTRVRKVNNIMDISAGGNHLIMLDSDGTVWGTGLNTNGQLGRNTTSNTTVPLKVLNETGTAEITNILKIAGGANYTLLMSEDGKVYSFGYNNYGQLAQGNTTRKLLPVLAKDTTGETITNAVDINARANAVSILRADGTAWTAGYNGYGAAANGTTATNTRYTQVLGELGGGVFSGGILVGNTDNTLAVADELGRVYTSGYNAQGQLGDGTTTNSKYLVGISNTSLEVKEPIVVLNAIGATKQIEAKVNLGFNILYNNLETESYTYKSLNPKIAEVDAKGIITAIKYGSTRIEVTNIETGNKATVIVNVLREGQIANPKIESGTDFTVALKSDGSVWTWGYNGYGQLGLGQVGAHIVRPTKVDINGIIDIACGTNHVLLLKQDGTIWAMGLNNYGQIGNNTTTNALTPVQVQGLEGVIRISAGANHSIALKSDGTVWSWGYNAYGQLGDATTTRKSLPVQVRIKDGISEIEAGHHSSIALDSDGNVWVWGLNTSYQLGLGTKANVLTPAKLNIDDISCISMGTNYSILVKDSGEVYSFGVNGSGQLGNGNTTNQKTPVKVVLPGNIPLTNIEYVSAGVSHVIAKTYDGKVFGWGLDSSYQFGDEVTTVKKNPVQITYDKTSDIITDVLDVSAGSTHSVIVKEDGTVWTAGKNNNGQIGDKTTVTRTAWVCISNTQIKVPETSITINKIGGTYELKPILDTGFNLLYDNMSDAKYTYTSKNTEIANVSNTGVITGVKRGKTKIGITETNTNKTIYVDVYVLDEKDIAFPQVITTEYTTVALKADGSVWTWGYNGNGQLGIGTVGARCTVPNKGRYK